MSSIVCENCGHVVIQAMGSLLLLTRRQRQCLDAIIAHVAATGETPNLRQVADHMGVKNKSRVHFYVGRLRELGFLAPVEPGRRPMLAPTEAARRLYER